MYRIEKKIKTHEEQFRVKCGQFQNQNDLEVKLRIKHKV